MYGNLSIGFAVKLPYVTNIGEIEKDLLKPLDKMPFVRYIMNVQRHTNGLTKEIMAMPSEEQPNSEAEGELKEWYTASEAAERLSGNSGKRIDPDYLFKLGHMGKVNTMKLGKRVTLYSKRDVDGYRVGGRGRRPTKGDKQSNAA
jgi:hypothetical protein